MITIGTDGKMRALRQVLTPPNFARVTPGLDKAQVRRILGQPAKAQFFELKQQEVWDWRWVDGQSNMAFAATFDRDGRVVGTASGADNADLNVGGKWHRPRENPGSRCDSSSPEGQPVTIRSCSKSS